MAEDENGNPTVCYAKITVENCRDDVTAEAIEKARAAGKKCLHPIDQKYITIVDIDEYNRECLEEGEKDGEDMG